VNIVAILSGTGNSTESVVHIKDKATTGVAKAIEMIKSIITQ
jgi:hypothetical protein